jgi:large subunit ribosomal protein L24
MANQDIMKVKIKRNDNVMVTAGKDRGKTGRVLRIDRDKARVVIEGLNMVKKAVRPKGQNQKGGISTVEAPLSLSNVQVVCKSCGPTRIGQRVEDDRKVRFCRKCGEVL